MLYFISTPIGNLNDISLRAIDVIRSCDYLYAEDTRTTKKLLDFINCDKRCSSFHEHNEDKISSEIINKIKGKKNIAIVSDAGTPVISDPGYSLIRDCIDQSIEYTLIPGPSSVINAIVMSGLSTDKFSFFGFMPKKKNDQEILFGTLKNDTKTSIFFESPKRLQKTISNLIEYVGKKRKISICKEMTKLHEKIIRGTMQEVLDKISNNEMVLKGEIVLVIQGSEKKQIDYSLDIKINKEFLKKLSVSDAAKLISLITGHNKRDIYKHLIDI